MTDETSTGVTLSRARPSSPQSTTAAFPTDLLEDAYSRLRLLTGFFSVAFGLDVLIWLGSLGWPALDGGNNLQVPFQLAKWINAGAVVISVAVFWTVHKRLVSVARLYTLGVLYELVICFTSATVTFWQYFADTGLIPNLTWVPAIVIMFPLILPASPRRVLGGAIASAAMAPLGLLALEASGNVDTAGGDGYGPATVGSIFAVVVAYLGAKVVYGLGREVAKARAMGSYQLIERLGSGGMGEVWRAHHQMLARPAAVKVIRPLFTGNGAGAPEAAQRFEREAQSIADLRSPHTVNLFDFGVASDGTYYYAMELLEGLDADAAVRRYGPMPVERTVHLLRQVCHSLSEAEFRGLVHRDIKPANIFLCQYGEDDDFVKVLDFGIVKKLHRTEQAEPQLTGRHEIHGTPAFMAPEQAHRETDIDSRTDIYAVGCVAYWLLTGSLVFTAETPTALLLKHIQSAPAAPSSRTELPIPKAMDALVLACLAKNPAERPQSFKELSRLLAAVETTDEWTPARSRRWWDAHRPTPYTSSANKHGRSD